MLKVEVSRNKYYDVLKALAIVAVVLYHFGACRNGYLGVDVFLVIAGYFTASSVEKHMLTNRGGI
jgi:peptidoglycan/LPS O-acetylase OafA/YrhL